MSKKISKKVLVVGDVMIDEYISGKSNRLSPEAPVPVIVVNNEFSVLGGAGNVANNLSSLSVDCSLFSFKGADVKSKLLDLMLSKQKINNLTFESDVPTISKTRIVSQKQQIVRIDRERKFNNSSLAIRNLNKEISKYKSSVVIISDYGKGICSKELVSSIIKKSKTLDLKTLIDPKGNNWEKYKGAFLVKPNVKELSDVIGFEIENEDDTIVYHGKKIMQKFNIKHLLVTRSEKGITLIKKDDVLHVKSEAKDIYDVSGAGDTVIATLAYAITEGKSITDSAKLANHAAGIVVSRFGTSTISKDDLILK